MIRLDSFTTDDIEDGDEIISEHEVEADGVARRISIWLIKLVHRIDNVSDG